MPDKLITTDDLMDFKLELFEELKKLFKDHSTANPKRYLRSTEVMELLNISVGTLQNMRINGSLPYTKIGGTLYYDWEEIQRIMLEYRVDNSY